MGKRRRRRVTMATQMAGVFPLLPLEIVVDGIMPYMARDWLYVCRCWSCIAAKHLMKDARVCDRIRNVNLFIWAAEHNQPGVITRLLSLPKLNLEFGHDALQTALELDQQECFILLASDARMKASLLKKSDVYMEQIIYFTFSEGRDKIASMILHDITFARSLNSFDLDDFLIKAIDDGHTNLVKVLLSDPRIDFRNNDYFAVQIAVINQNNDILTMMTQHPCVGSIIVKRIQDDVQNNASDDENFEDFDDDDYDP